MTRVIPMIAALALACGSVQPTVNSGQALVDGFPSKPWPGQRRPGKDGRCPSRHGPPLVIVKGGGCWLSVVVDPADCEAAHSSGNSYLVPFEGHCYYPDFELAPQREPTSRTEQSSSPVTLK